MYGIIPLAGPDCYTSEGIKPLRQINGRSLIEEALYTRPWVRSGELACRDMIFVLRDDPDLPLLLGHLRKSFPGCLWVVISDLTKGALLSALAGMALIKDFRKPIAVDLVDLIYDCSFSPCAAFEEDEELLGIIPYFLSDNPKYSYLAFQKDRVVRTVEKQVISSHASAGTYFFRDFYSLSQAISRTADQEEKYHYRENLFLCPSFNPLTTLGKVSGVEVEMRNEVSLQFH